MLITISTFWEKIFAGVPQGSILGPLLLNIFMNDLFFFVSSSNLSNYAEGNTLYSSGFNIEEVKNCLSTDFDAVTKWFYENHIALNAGKSHLICLGKDTRKETFIFKGLAIKNSKQQKILGVTIDYKLTFKSHIKSLCEKSAQKIGTLSRLSNHLNDSQKRLVLNSIGKSQFSYCPLVWIFCARTFNNMIYKVHERVLRVTLNDYESDFETLLQNNNDVCNHQRNTDQNLIKILKIKKRFYSSDLRNYT